MGLIDLKTDLKSLKYGKDTPGGGDSKQPFIKSKIPDKLTSKSPDFLLRNGYLSPVSTIEDVSRLSKFFTTTEGVLFTVKQNLLSRTAVSSNYTPGVTINNPLQLNEGVYTPLSTLAQAGVVSLGGHLNKQGLNPFAETGIYANNPNLYFNKTRDANFNSLNQLTTNEVVTEANTRLVPGEIIVTDTENPSFILGGNSNSVISNIIQIIRDDNIEQLSSVFQDNAQFSNRLAKLWYDKIYSKTDTSNILTYPGGPWSVLGIGKTNIRFADQRTGVNSTKNIDGKKTWVPTSYVNRSFTSLIKKEIT